MIHSKSNSNLTLQLEMSEDTMEYLNVLFGVCKRVKTDYYHATLKQREFIDAVAMLESGNKGHSRVGKKGPFPVNLKGPIGYK